MQQFANWFGITPRTTVLDVGGNSVNRSFASARPKLVAVNPYKPKLPADLEIPWVVADGRHLPFRRGQFDVAYSNSVIEHLGDRTSQERFAREKMRVAKRYYVQTPNRRFPMEPHLLTPGFQFLPLGWQRKLIRNFTIWGLVTRPTHKQCNTLLSEICLLHRRDLEELVPPPRSSANVSWVSRSP